ncbi:DUF5123 domain-containing protein [Flavobacterium seoulense]|uniref:Fibronectin n=1 Tax=Flavobacterium seoulense TaxID=1492738 RepID=A0A066WPV4_9FLAO|nr:DUF5123 domain-containing protein [Flavobacterium seoulense]KDN55841.1 fibronectin [Flavobacterium seoulense]
MMKTKYILKGVLTSIFFILVFSGCESYSEDVIDELLVDRAFSPIGVTARVRNQTNVELNWTAREGVDHYVVEFSADDETFSTIYKTVSVSAAELPVTVALEGETVYSIRIKAVSATGANDSKWVIGKVTTLSEQIFTSIVDGDILSKEATLRWIPNSTVTQINLVPGNITHVITAQEKINGVATITGLNPETAYTATLYNGTKKRGVQNFTTGIDIGDGILVKNTDDLLVVIANANSGAKLFLEPGEYKSFGVDGVTPNTDIVLTKSITISGIPGKAKPVLRYKVTVNAGTSNVSLLDLELDGRVYNTSGVLENITNASVITVAGASSNYGDFIIKGCKIHDFTRALIAANASTSKVNSFTVENSIITNVNTNVGADFIDFRNTYVANVTLKNSTFEKCSNQRDFVRIDAATGFSGTGLTTTVLIDACTIYNTTMTSSNRILYVRFLNNALTVRKTLFANTAAIYSNQANTANPTFLNNNYFNSTGLHTTATKFDSSGTFTLLDPGFANAATGDFTISNQNLKDNLIGDPLWIK